MAAVVFRQSWQLMLFRETSVSLPDKVLQRAVLCKALLWKI
jgi:hypothetical protein